VFNVAGHHPILGFCNAASKIFFWDFSRLTSYHEYMTALREPNRDKNTPVARPDWLKPIYHRKARGDTAAKHGDVVTKLRESNKDRDVSDKDSVASGLSGTPDPDRVGFLSGDFSPDTIEDWEKKYNMEDPHGLVKAHKVEMIKAGGNPMVGRQVAWSPEGEWCVVVGSNNRAIIMQRWPQGEGATPVEDGSE